MKSNKRTVSPRAIELLAQIIYLESLAQAAKESGK